MGTKQKTVIVTGASQGIGAGVVQAFLNGGYNVVANSRNITKSGAFTASDQLVLVDGNIGESAVAAKVAETAVSKFGSIDALVNNAGIFFAKAFTDYTAEDFKALSTTNREGFLYVTQRAVKQIACTKIRWQCRRHHPPSSLVVNPIAGVPVSVPMITKGGLEAVTRSTSERVCEGAHPFQHCCSWCRGYSPSQEQSQRLSEVALTDGYDLRRERHCGRSCLSHRGP